MVGLADSGAGLGDALTILRGTNTQLSNIYQAIIALFPRVTGNFTLGAAASHTVTEPGVKATSIIILSPTNAAAGTLMGSAKSLYVSAKVAGASFTVTTASGAAAAGTEQFSYAVLNTV